MNQQNGGGSGNNPNPINNDNQVMKISLLFCIKSKMYRHVVCLSWMNDFLKNLMKLIKNIFSFFEGSKQSAMESATTT